MAELDSLIDSLIQQRIAGEVSYLDDKENESLKVEQIPSKGQGVFAKQFLSVNNPICALRFPTVAAIDASFLQTTCYHCLIVTATQLPLQQSGLASVELKTCSGCLSARFCSRQCQVESWRAYHKYECKIFKKLRGNLPPTILRAVLRMVLLKDRDLLPEDEWNRIVSLTAHDEILAARGRSNITEMAESIKHLAESGMSVDMIQKLIFIMKFNAIELPTPIHGPIGVMLQPIVGKFNHNCEPNVALHRSQHTMTSNWMNSTELSEDERRTFGYIVPLRDIQPGEELLNCYVVPTVSVGERKAKFQADYFFECSCPRCQLDSTAATDLSNTQPTLQAQFEQWTKDVQRHLSRIGENPDAFQKAAAAMDKSERFLDYPVLYTTGDFPELAMTLVQEGVQAQALDAALINLLRTYFLVYPRRLIGRHNPTNIYSMFLILALLDAIIGISTAPEPAKDRRGKWLTNLSDRGLDKASLFYWRCRLCADLRKRVEGSAVKDLLNLIEQLEERAKNFKDEDNSSQGETLEGRAEDGMRAVLRLKEPQWKSVLQENGC